jgi:hypothetical protein
VTPGSTSMGLWVAGVEDADEGGEEVGQAVAQLLDVGVLVGGALVAVDGEALPDLAALAIEALAEGLHDELLQVLREQDQAVGVGEDDHRLAAVAVGQLVPGEGEQGGRVFLQVGVAGGDVHGRGAAQEAAPVEAEQGGGEQADGGEHGGAAADPVPQGEAGEPALFVRRACRGCCRGR